MSAIQTASVRPCGKVRHDMVSTRREFLAGGISTALSYSLFGCRGSIPYDVCVIGSGFAGTFLALKMVEHGLRTIMV